MPKGTWKRGQFAESAGNWQKGYAAAKANLTAGVANTPKDPTTAAVAQIDQLIAGFNAATTGGNSSVWARNLLKAGKASWQAGMTAFAAAGLAAKAAKGQPHYAEFAQQYGSTLMGRVAALPPRGDFEANMTRSSTLNSWAHQNKGKYKKLWR